MADIFISYSKVDRAEAVKLSAYLETLGYSVWWDHSLTSGEEYRDAIVVELAKARAVIVIWSPASVRSDWVRSEAGRANADRKLIPVRTGGVDYKDIPPPFDVLHTEPAGNLDNLRAAVVGQLAKPQERVPFFRRVVSGAKYQALSWFGIVGAAITLFTGLKGVVELADWAHWLIDHWADISRALWQPILSWIGIAVAQDEALLLTFVFFCMAMTVSSRLLSTRDVPREQRPRPSIWRLTLALAVAVIVATVLFAVEVMIMVWLSPGSSGAPPQGDALPQAVALVMAFAMIGLPLLGMFESLRWTLKTPARDTFALWAFFFLTLVLIFALPGVNLPQSARGAASLGKSAALAFVMFVLTPTLMLAAGNSRRLLRRLSLAVAGLVLLFVLNKLSTLGLDLRAPRPPIS
jgi:TIR domain